ncbi:S41 family peptidase [Candidatus Parcubacteria bacterium]|nr:S41 family peptidase [Candidatus Parcubacteria bacterium]
MKNKYKPRLKLPKNFFKGAILIALVFSLGVILGQQRVISFNLPTERNEASQNNRLPNKLNYQGVEEVYDELKASFDGNLDPDELINGLKEGLVKASGDPYTEYLNAEESKDFEEGLSGSFEGIGAELGKEEQAIVIVAPIEGFPAAKTGIKAKDIVAEIDGESAYDLSITEAVKKIRGPKGTKVKLGIIRNGEKLDIEVSRAQISIPSVEIETLESNIGVIKITRFGEDTVQLVKEAARDFKAKQVNKVILDLRGNPGGLLEASVGVSEIWLPKGATILQEKRDEVVIKTYTSQNTPMLGGIKTAVLINEGSASASEIVGGALKDNNAATLFGEQSYGKGSVQEVKPLDFGGLLKVTIARWFTPNGRNIDKEGIEPDKKVELTDKDAEAKKDPQRDAAIRFLKQ